MSSNMCQVIMLGVALFGHTMLAAADEYVSTSSVQEPTVRIVNDLLMLDAGRASIAEREKLLEAIGQKSDKGVKTVQSSRPANEERPPVTAPEPKQTEKAPAPTVFDVQGIYGLGNNLYADVTVNGQLVKFQRGRAAPLGMSDYKVHLVSIDVPCIKLMEGKTVINTCLTKAGL